MTERNEERTTLRRQLAGVNDALAAGFPQVERTAEPEESDPGDEAAVDAPRTILIPSFAPSCGDELRGLPAAVARRAMVVVAALAGGDTAAWRQAKQMTSAAEPLFTCRVGIHHRVLFRIAGGALAVLCVVHRKDLEGAIKRHGRIAVR